MSAITTHQIHREILEALHPRVFTNQTVAVALRLMWRARSGLRRTGSTCIRGSTSSRSAFLRLSGRPSDLVIFASALSQHRGL